VGPWAQGKNDLLFSRVESKAIPISPCHPYTYTGESLIS
jgi:hypothetical protein